MTFKWAGPILLLAALVIGDQIRLNRPGHKYRLSVGVETPDGLKSASGVFAVVPYRGYSVSGATHTRGDALFVDLGHGKSLVALMLTRGEKGAETEGMNYVALRAYAAAGHRVSFGNIGQMTGAVPLTGELIPVLITFSDLADPKTARVAPPDDLAHVFGAGYRLNEVSVSIVKNGWPLDFGGALGEPVTRSIEAKLPWWNGADAPAAAALRAAGLVTGIAGGPPPDDREAFTRK